jgi:tetratricopeptide (TPR) repeat protein
MPLRISSQSSSLVSSEDFTQEDFTQEDTKPPIVWHGSFFAQHSLALVNRELTGALLNDADFAAQFDLRIDHYGPLVPELSGEARFAPLAARMGSLPDAPAVTIRHRWPPEFGPVAAGKMVLIQPWEFGSLPRHWVSAIERNVDEVWAYSQFVRDTYITSGVEASKIVVVPCGVNTRQFHPGVAPYDFGKAQVKASAFKFLFVGGTIARKGIDVLLDAYDRAFTAQDPVVLIIKDFGTDSFYANQGAATLIRALQAKPNGAKIVYLNHDMTEAEIAGLYAACDCLVHPYRGEGYGLPIAEAMACGKPTIVTGFGAALDFANPSNAYLIPADTQRLPEKRVGDLVTVDYPFWANPDPDALIALLRHVVTNRDEAQAKGEQAARDIAALHTWDHAAQIASERIQALATEAQDTRYKRQGAKDKIQEAQSEIAFPMGLGGLRLGNTGMAGISLPGSLKSPGLLAAGDMYEDRKQAALQETRSGDWRAAQAQLDACLTERPDDWDVVNALAVVCFRMGDKQRAFDLLRQGIAVSPNPRDLHHNLAFVLLADNQAEEALEHALLAFAPTPDDANLRRTVERAQQAVLKKARLLLRGVPDKQRATARRTPAYRALMERYERAENALKEEGSRKKEEGDASAFCPPPSTLSLCMIVKNEERFLRNCLESAKDVVDEIVIVDTGSTDGTLAIAREYGAKIIEYVWNDDFSEARNLSLQHATGTWALWMDADEEIAPGSGVHFREAIQSAPDHVGGYMVKFHNWLTSATRPEPGQEIDGEMAVHHACRLFRRVDGVKFEGRIHEQNLRSLQALGYTYARMDGLLLDHWGYAGEIMTLRNKHERFIRMLTREVDECPDEGFRHFHLFNLGNAYFTAGDMENAVYNFSLASKGVSAEEEFAITLFVEWATALHRLQRPWEGLDVCAQIDEMGVRQAGIDFARGYCLLHTEQYEAAEMAFQSAIDQGREAANDLSNAQTGDVGASTYKAQYGLALALVGQDRHEAAVAPCREALETQPSMVETRYLLSIVLTHLDRTYEASLELETILTQTPDNADAVRDLSTIYLAAKDWDQALPHLRSISWQNPADGEALARLSFCCEQLGLLEEARDGYERLRMLDSESVEVCVNLGRVLAALDEAGEALECYTEAIQRDPLYGNAYFNAGDLMYRLGYYDRAADTYMAGLEVSPDHDSGFFVLGNCYFRTQAYAAAVVSYRQALVLSPTNQEARSNLQLAEQRAREVGQEIPAA